MVSPTIIDKPIENCRIRAALILIGNEILSGKVQDVNSQCLATSLRKAGIDLMRIITVPDDLAEIAWALGVTVSSYDYVFTSGGIGPTHDDVTIQAVAEALGVKVVSDERMEAILRERKGENITPAHLRMALMPEGSVLHFGVKLGLPLIQFRNIFIMPGVPQAFQAKMDTVIHLLEGRCLPVCLRWVTSNLDEGLLADSLEELLCCYPGISIGSYPSWEIDGSFRVRISIESRDGEMVEEAAQVLEKKLEWIAACRELALFLTSNS